VDDDEDLYAYEDLGAGGFPAWWDQPDEPRPTDSTDPFAVIGEIPPDTVYQWVAFAIAGDEALADAIYKGPMSAGGWYPVSPSRHPSMPSVNGCIEVLGQVLMQRSKEENDAARQRELDKAEDLRKRSDQEQASPFMPAPPWQHVGETAEDIEAKAVYAALPEQGKLRGVMVQIGVEVSERDTEIAASLKLSIYEYTRRRVYMDTVSLGRKSEAIFTNSGDAPIFSMRHFYEKGKQHG
jgi:hypothetical protein